MNESDIMSVFLGGNRTKATRADAQFPNVAEGVIVETTAQGVRFTIPSWDGGKHKFGPAPWPRTLVETNTHSHPTVGVDTHDHEGSIPTVGARCLVLFVPPGIARPWVIAWWPT